MRACFTALVVALGFLSLGFQAPAEPIPPFSLDLVSVEAAKTANTQNVAGLKLLKKKDFGAAYEQLADAVRANPRHVLARYNLACAAAQLGPGFKEVALEQLEALAQAKGCAWCQIKARGAAADPDLVSLAPEPRFTALGGEPEPIAPNATCAVLDAEAPVRLPPDVKTATNQRVSPDGQWMVFVGGYGTSKSLPPVREVDEADIWAMSFDGAKLVQLTKSRLASGPSFAPDSRTVVFVDKDDLVRSTVTGSGRKRLIKSASPKKPQGEYDYETFEAPVVSADSEWVAAGTTSGATVEVVVAPFKGGKRQRVFEVEAGCWGWSDGVLKVGSDGRFSESWDPKTGKRRTL